MGAKVGTQVLYTLSGDDAQAINRRREDYSAFRGRGMREVAGASGRNGHQGHVGNSASQGQQYPAVIVRVFDPSTTTANLKVHLDGNDAYWATSRQLGDVPGSYQLAEDVESFEHEGDCDQVDHPQGFAPSDR